jgi:ABC-2 type transport system ATP-binding protein
LAKEFHIDSVLDEPIFSYSHGMRQKILIIGALLHHPDNWILDEPMTGLDPEASFEVKSMMKEEAKKGHCILFSTHVLEVAEKVCDRVGIIQNGKLLFAGTMAELRGKENQGGDLEDLFLELTKE